MKKEALHSLIIMAFFVVLALIVGFFSTPRPTSSNKIDGTALEMSNLKSIHDNEYLVYSVDTHIVYYMFSTNKGYSGYSYFSPYISENGNFCQYVNGEIVEVTQNTNN
ncbi:MAG: hypothetical protein HFJ40_04140 [Clostridia bacterium]|nr:hypothetical protein [Clostridia bacterium]